MAWRLRRNQFLSWLKLSGPSHRIYDGRLAYFADLYIQCLTERVLDDNRCVKIKSPARHAVDRAHAARRRHDGWIRRAAWHAVGAEPKQGCWNALRPINQQARFSAIEHETLSLHRLVCFGCNVSSLTHPVTPHGIIKHSTDSTVNIKHGITKHRARQEPQQ